MSTPREFHDGRGDGLVALESLDLDKVTSFAGLTARCPAPLSPAGAWARPST